MEFIKVGKNYMIKNGNGRIITEQEKLELENKELIIKDIQSNECQAKTTQKLTRNKKRLKKITAPQKENADDIIKETDSTL
jgi:exosome complex RNA-binding protein Rrp4